MVSVLLCTMRTICALDHIVVYHNPGIFTSRSQYSFCKIHIYLLSIRQITKFCSHSDIVSDWSSTAIVTFLLVRVKNCYRAFDFFKSHFPHSARLLRYALNSIAISVLFLHLIRIFRSSSSSDPLQWLHKMMWSSKIDTCACMINVSLMLASCYVCKEVAYPFTMKDEVSLLQSQELRATTIGTTLHGTHGYCMISVSALIWYEWCW